MTNLVNSYARGNSVLTVSQFLQLMRGYVGYEKNSVQAYCAFVFWSFMKEPYSEHEQALDENDGYYPFNKKSEKTGAYRMFNGERGIPEDALRAVHGKFDKSRFLEAADAIPFDARRELCDKLAKHDIQCTTDNVGETCAEIFRELVDAAWNKLEGISPSPFERRNDVGEVIPPVPISPVRYSDGTIYMEDGTRIRLSKSLMPNSDEEINNRHLPYIQALCELYAEKTGESITPDDMSRLSSSLQKHLERQRTSYFNAKSIQHSVRDTFADGEKQFDALKDDTYEGIEMVYYNDSHETGYDRLQAVLEKATNSELAESNLMNVKGLITNQSRKGVCHILVDDERIKSWVDTDA